VAYYALVNCDPTRSCIPGQPWEELCAFQNKAWEKDKDASKFLRLGVTDEFVLAHKSFVDLAKRAEQLLPDMVADPLFKPLLGQTQSALSRTREEWEADYVKSSSIMRELTGLKLDGDFDVQITHPSQRNGHGGNPIGWTYRQDFPHYNTVYLWHEIMHSFIEADRHADAVVNVEHAVIQLLTDNELRVRFNGGTYPPLEGHKETVPMMERLLEDWRAYLAGAKKEIMEFLKLAREKCATKSTETTRDLKSEAL